jgi:hypothetical protein
MKQATTNAGILHFVEDDDVGHFLLAVEVRLVWDDDLK